jgi:hypothetical protein
LHAGRVSSRLVEMALGICSNFFILDALIVKSFGGMD